MRRRAGRCRHGPGLLGTAARTAVIAGTATSVSGRVAASQAAAARPAAPVVVPGSVARAPSVDELHAQLVKLGELRQSGLLTDEEFAQQKARLLG